MQGSKEASVSFRNWLSDRAQGLRVRGGVRSGRRLQKQGHPAVSVEGLEDRRLFAAVNDPFSGRIALSGTTATVSGTTVGATKESGEPNHGLVAGGHSVWYSW